MAIEPINVLTQAPQIKAGDLISIFSTNNGGAYRIAISQLEQFMQDNLLFTSGLYPLQFYTQYSTPSSTGFNIQISAGSGTTGSENVWLILTPTGTFAAGTITLPDSSTLVDKQEVLVNCTQIVTSLTIDGNGATSVIGAPTTLAANASFRLRYDQGTNNWYKVG